MQRRHYDGSGEQSRRAELVEPVPVVAVSDETRQSHGRLLRAVVHALADIELILGVADPEIVVVQPESVPGHQVEGEHPAGSQRAAHAGEATRQGLAALEHIEGIERRSGKGEPITYREARGVGPDQPGLPVFQVSAQFLPGDGQHRLGQVNAGDRIAMLEEMLGQRSHAAAHVQDRGPGVPAIGSLVKGTDAGGSRTRERTVPGVVASPCLALDLLRREG